MSRWSVVRWTGVLGLAAVAIQLVGVVFAATAGSAPSVDDPAKLLSFTKSSHFTLTTVEMLFLVGFAIFIGFIAGLRAIAVAAAPTIEWLATATFGAGVAITVVGVISAGVALAAISIATSTHAETAQIRLLFEIERTLGGAAWLVPAAFFFGAAGSLGAATRIFPRWLTLAGWIGSIVALVAAFSAYGTSDPSIFWSANGSVTILGFLPFWVWTLCASIVFLRQKETGAR
jgi:hypothetical protein